MGFRARLRGLTVYEIENNKSEYHRYDSSDAQLPVAQLFDHFNRAPETIRIYERHNALEYQPQPNRAQECLPIQHFAPGGLLSVAGGSGRVGFNCLEIPEEFRTRIQHHEILFAPERLLIRIQTAV